LWQGYIGIPIVGPPIMSAIHAQCALNIVCRVPPCWMSRSCRPDHAFDNFFNHYSPDCPANKLKSPAVSRTSPCLPRLYNDRHLLDQVISRCFLSLWPLLFAVVVLLSPTRDFLACCK
jgi:hypothetical protein